MNGVEIATQAGNIRGRLKQAMSERGIDGAPALAGVCSSRFTRLTELGASCVIAITESGIIKWYNYDSGR